MDAWVIDREPFDRGGRIQLAIGRDQRHRPEAGGLMESAYFQGGGQLHGVIGSQPVATRQLDRSAEERGGDLKDAVALRQVAAEMAEDGPTLGGGQAAAALSPGNGGRHLDGRDAGEIDRGGAFAPVKLRTQAVPVSRT